MADSGCRTARLFGTDGLRGLAGELLSAELALAVARAATRLATGGGAPQVLVIRDTRESGPMLEAAVAAGVSAAGADALLGGVLPTPAAPLLMGQLGLDLGIVLSASHNPYQDNGIKIFGGDGFKLDDELEREIEAQVRGGAQAAGRRAASASGAGGRPGTAAPGQPRFGCVRELLGAREDYVRELQRRFCELDLSGLDVLLDCANGAAYRAAPEIFRRLGAEVSTLNDAPDGRNINAGCGSTHVEALAAAVRDGGHAIGFAFDGDGDRVLAVDSAGAVVDGDELMALMALQRRRGGALGDAGVVVTVMSNYGFHSAMERAGIPVATTGVGDRYVLEELRSRGWALGGEQSGHIVDLAFNRCGDGIASALLALEALAGRSLADRDAMEKLPQRLVNVRVRDRGALERAEVVQAAVRREHATLAGRGRVLVRASGTEALVRVMVEAPTGQEADEVCGRLVAVVESELA